MIMIRMRRNRRMYQATPNVSLTPLIDTALTLLVVFMVAAPVAHYSVQVDLPQGQTQDTSAAKQEPKEIIITIDRDGNLYLAHDKLKRAELISALKKLFHKSQKSPTLYLRVDRRSEAGLAIEMLTELRSIEGVECVEFAIDAQARSS
jgi:biopolymer transport protein ExbD